MESHGYSWNRRKPDEPYIQFIGGFIPEMEALLELSKLHGPHVFVQFVSEGYVIEWPLCVLIHAVMEVEDAQVNFLERCYAEEKV